MFLHTRVAPCLIDNRARALVKPAHSAVYEASRRGWPLAPGFPSAAPLEHRSVPESIPAGLWTYSTNVLLSIRHIWKAGWKRSERSQSRPLAPL